MTAVTDTPDTADATKVALAAELATGLRALADMVEANPEISTPYLHGSHGVNVWFPRTPEEMLVIARAALRHGAKVDKKVFDDSYNLTISWGRFIAKSLSRRDNVCTRVQVGEETVTRKERDPEAVATALAEIPEVEVTETVPKYDWKCEPLMGHGTGAVA